MFVKLKYVVLNNTPKSRNGCPEWEGYALSEPGAENGCHRGQPSKYGVQNGFGVVPSVSDGAVQNG